MIITIYRENETIEYEIKNGLGKDFPSNKVVGVAVPVERDGAKEILELYIRPYYRKKVNGVLNIFCEEEIDYGK